MITIDSFNIKQELFEGDLCYLDGYGKRMWTVIGSSKIKTSLFGVTTEDLTYYLECVFTGQEIVGLQEDAILICRAKDSYEFLRDYDGNIPESEFELDFNEKDIDYEAEWERVDVTNFANTIREISELDLVNSPKENIKKEENIMSNNDNGTRRLTAAEIRKKREREPSYDYPGTIDGLLDRLNDLNSQKEILGDSVDEDLLLEIELVHEDLKDKHQEMNR